jgi:alpha-tubulin suppressor-like RCC1 family protein
MKENKNLKQAVESLGDEFELVRELGRGATSVVYLLKDHALDRDVALKVIRAGYGGDEEALARLQREARLVAQLQHPNIVKLYGTHRLPDGRLALLMEHVPGRNLKEILRKEGPLEVPRTLSLLRDVASALAYAHRRRIVHRDVKPENIYIDEEVGSARLADFGVARPWDQDARLTLPGASLGTPAYMSPEQIDGKEVDGRSDVYSLGLVGYELLLGHHPWEGENVFTIIYKQKNEKLPFEELGLGGSPNLARLLKKALEKEAEDRWESAEAFLAQLSEMGVAPPEDSGIRDDPGMATPIVTDGDTDFGHFEGDMSPVDWDNVAAVDEGTPAVSLREEEEATRRRRAPLGAIPLRRRGIRMAALATILVAGSYGAYRWLSATEGTTDPTGFSSVPVSSVGPEAATPQPRDPPTEAEPSLAASTAETLSGVVGSLIPLAVRANGDGGVPLADTLVLFLVEEGDGILESAEARTDAEGAAEVNLRLPNRPGAVVVSATVAGSEDLRTQFELTALPGSPRRVTSIVGDQQRAGPGEILRENVGVRVLDEFGNSVPGNDVRFSIVQGGGRISPEVTQTDEAGRAFARWTLGGTEGTQLVIAQVSGVQDAPVTFRATAWVEPEPVPEPPEDPRETPRPGPVVVVPKTFAMGGSHICHLTNGNVVCRGPNDLGQGGDGSLTGLVGLTAGVSHSCGLDISGGSWCWGANGSGQLGDLSTEDRRPAASVTTDVPFSMLVAGVSHTCGLAAGGQAYCWGRNLDGQLGDGSRGDHLRPAPTAGNQSFQELVAGWDHTCGLTGGGRAFCWGANLEGQLGDGTTLDRLTPAPVPGSYWSITAGHGHTCGISGEEIRCWGDNAFGQLGDGTTEDRTQPVTVEGLPGPPIVLAAGANHTCAVLSDSSAYCWGQNLHGQLGDGTTQNRSSPVAVSGGLEFVTIFAGGGATCGFSTDGGEYCWGLNQGGQLGDGTRTNRSSPVRVGGDSPYSGGGSP